MKQSHWVWGVLVLAAACGGRAGESSGAPNTGDAGSANHYSCERPMTDATTGIVTCANGLTHRPAPFQCTNVAAAGASGEGGASAGAQVGDACESNADCAGIPNGFCEGQGVLAGGRKVPRLCATTCKADSDCTGVCDCSRIASLSASLPLGSGVCDDTAGCRTDADCGAGFLCASVALQCGDARAQTYLCQSALDECQVDSDCSGLAACAISSASDGPLHRKCYQGYSCE